MFRHVLSAIQFPKIDSNYYITKHHAQIDRSYLKFEADNL